MKTATARDRLATVGDLDQLRAELAAIRLTLVELPAAGRDPDELRGFVAVLATVISVGVIFTAAELADSPLPEPQNVEARFDPLHEQQKRLLRDLVHVDHGLLEKVAVPGADEEPGLLEYKRNNSIRIVFVVS